MNPLAETPIAVFAHRRPRHLRLALEALARNPEYASLPLHIYCDAATADRDRPACEATRRVARAWVARHGGAIVERPRNFGFRNIIEGVTELCQAHGQVIVIEDDIIVSPDFLAYVLGSLDRYLEDPRVFLVSGYMYAAAHPPAPQLFFLPISLVWGWATWKRAWDHYEYHPDDWQQILADPQVRSRFNASDNFPFYRNLKETMSGEFDTWDTQWYYALFKAGGLGLHPYRSLVWNMGVEGGVHGGGRADSLDVQHPIFAGDLQRRDLRRPRLRAPWSWPRPEVDLDAWQRVQRALAGFGFRL